MLVFIKIQSGSDNQAADVTVFFLNLQVYLFE